MSASARPPSEPARTRATQIVMLGTGTPRPDPERSGPATAIIVNDTPYLIDFGPGVIRRVAQAYQRGVRCFGPHATGIRTAFVTHLHADHTAGYPDLLLTPWILGRRHPLALYGPKGIKGMTAHVRKAWAVDIDNRVNGTDGLDPNGCRVKVCEIKAGPIYCDRNISVTAFPAEHAGLRHAFGFRFETPDRTIVISGDTAPTAALAEHCRGCDVLIHEAYSQRTYAKVARKWQAYRRTAHTSSSQLAALAREVKPKLLVLYHRSNPGGSADLADPEEAVMDEIRSSYGGKIMTAHDLDVF
jgi:ribonuclease BN (tRNA processing enzyme)